MIPELRRRFNEAWTPDQYQRFNEQLDRTAGTHVGFRCSETPVFLPKPLLEKMIRYGIELYTQLAANTAYREASEATIPDRFRTPNESKDPLFIQADFGLVQEEDGSFEPKLVEIQGFPSLYGLQPVLANVYRDVYGLDPALRSLLDGLDESSYVDLLRTAILNGHAPEEVALLEIDPYEQKTLADFLVTQKMLGIEIASLTDVEKRGRKLFHKGKQLKRIYNRVIVDELQRKNTQAAFAFSDDLDVEWAGHPNWFFRLSKFSLPWFEHRCVPETRFLSDVDELPPELDRYVLKPLYSFAGLGVKIAPTREEIMAIPIEQRSDYILQERMNFASTIETPEGLTKMEIRIMYIFEGRMRPVTTIIRTGRGKMMGVDFNKNLDWVGASAGFYID